MAKTLHFRTEGSCGEWYAADEQGRITRPDKHPWMKPSGQWLFLGAARRWNRNGIDITLDAAFADPASLKGTYVFDRDWEDLSRKTKAEILQGNLQKDRLIHRTTWDRQVDALMRASR